jgi:GTP pyrophosphokinase
VLAAIGYGKTTARAVLGARRVGGAARSRRTGALEPDQHTSAVKRALGGGGEQKIKVTGMDDLMVVLARCCNWIRGERIVGYITRGKGGLGPYHDLSQRRQPVTTERRIEVE